MASQNIKRFNISLALKEFAMDGNKTRFSSKLYESDHVVKIMCWSNLALYKAFYRHMRVWVHRQDAFWELPNAQSRRFPMSLAHLTLWVDVFQCLAAQDLRNQLFFCHILSCFGPGGEPLKEGYWHWLLTTDYYWLLTTDYLLLTTYTYT